MHALRKSSGITAPDAGGDGCSNFFALLACEDLADCADILRAKLATFQNHQITLFVRFTCLAEIVPVWHNVTQ